MKSLEQMAKEKIQRYMDGMPQLGIKGLPLNLAVERAKDAMIGWDDVFDAVAKQMSKQAV